MKKKVWIGLLALVVAVAAAALLSSLLGGGRTLPEGAAAMYKDTAISEETVPTWRAPTPRRDRP